MVLAVHSTAAGAGRAGCARPRASGPTAPRARTGTGSVAAQCRTVAGRMVRGPLELRVCRGDQVDAGVGDGDAAASAEPDRR